MCLVDSEEMQGHIRCEIVGLVMLNDGEVLDLAGVLWVGLV